MIGHGQVHSQTELDSHYFASQIARLRWANVGSGWIGRGRKADVEPTLGQRLQFEFVRRRVMVSGATLAQCRHTVGLVAVS